VVLADTVPPGSTFQSASAGCTHVSGTVTCNIGSLASGAGALIDVVVRPTAAGTMTNNASVSAAQADPFGFNNSSALGVPVAAAVRLGNISTRMQVLTGNDVLIGGFIIGGAGAKRVAIVATGPSLTQYGITNALANPTLTLVRQSDQAVMATNDDWQSAANSAQLTAAGFAPSNALESAILIDLAPGAYTAIVSGAGNGTGVGVVAVYEVDHPEYPLVNISTRGQVLTGNDVMIGGFIIFGTTSQTVAVVATGPSLTQYGIANALANPTLTLVRSSDQSVIATNDDWQTDASASQLQSLGFAPSNPLESAILVTLPPGAYTAILSGKNGGTGVGIIGVYATPVDIAALLPRARGGRPRLALRALRSRWGRAAWGAVFPRSRGYRDRDGGHQGRAARAAVGDENRIAAAQALDQTRRASRPEAAPSVHSGAPRRGRAAS
jgi:hypothetical protein